MISCPHWIPYIQTLSFQTFMSTIYLYTVCIHCCFHFLGQWLWLLLDLLFCVLHLLWEVMKVTKAGSITTSSRGWREFQTRSRWTLKRCFCTRTRSTSSRRTRSTRLRSVPTCVSTTTPSLCCVLERSVGWSVYVIWRYITTRWRRSTGTSSGVCRS